VGDNDLPGSLDEAVLDRAVPVPDPVPVPGVGDRALDGPPFTGVKATLPGTITGVIGDLPCAPGEKVDAECD